jgi:hypothetical protein
VIIQRVTGVCFATCALASFISGIKYKMYFLLCSHHTVF